MGTTQEQESEFQVEPVEKPLNQTQLKNLRELVSGDFEELRAKVTRDIDKRLGKKKEEIEEKYKDVANLEEAREKLIQAKREAEDALREVVSEITRDGKLAFLTHSGTPVAVPFDVEVNHEALRQVGKKDELNRAENAARELKTAAIRIISREERSIQRLCLLQAITSSAATTIINDLPKPEDVMPLVGAELMAESENEMMLLMSEDEVERSRAALETREESA